MNSPSKLALFAYPTLVVFAVMAGVFMIGPGAIITLVFLMGIITIPLAFIAGTLPTIGLTLALSLPFYFIQIYFWPAKTARSIILSVLLGLGLSAAICQLIAVKLTWAAKAFTSGDIVQSPDFSGKSVFVIGTRASDECGDVCEMLIFLAGARQVTISGSPAESGLPMEFKGNSFELLPTIFESCEYSPRGIARNLRTYFAENGHCVTTEADNTITPDLILVIGEKNKPFQDIDTLGFNPFSEAAYADRTSVFALSDGKPFKVFQFTAATAFPPAPILAPISIAKGPHTSAERGFVRRRIEIRAMPALEHLFLSEEQLSKARSVLQSPAHRDRILALLKKGQLSKRQESLVRSYVDGVVLKGHDRSAAVFEIAGKLIASAEFASPKLARDLVEALRPNTNAQWSILSSSMFAVAQHYTDIAHAEGIQKIRGSFKSISHEIAKLPPEQLLKQKNQLAALAGDPLTINTTSATFAGIAALGKEAFPILRTVFRSSKSAFQTSDATKYASFRISQTPSYRTAVVALCKLAEAGEIDGAAIHQLLDDGSIAGDFTFLKAVALTDFDDLDRLSILQNEDYIFPNSPKDIILENRKKHRDTSCS